MALGPGAEFDLIRRILAGEAGVSGPPAGGAKARRTGEPSGWEVRVGPGDDCAVVAVGGTELAVSTDMMVEDVHFRRDWLTANEIGYRAAAAALSDLAAVAARPVGVLVSVASPAGDVPEAAVAVMEGVKDAAARQGAALLGGDVAASPRGFVLDVVVLGVPPYGAVLRAGARPGDEVWVTGELGAAAAAVARWRAGAEPPEAARAAFARPRPRVREALWLAERSVARALIDLSDGLAGDIRHLAAAGGVAVVLDPAAVPVHPAAHEAAGDAERALRLALGGGEDYELCFAAAPGAVDAVASEFMDRFGLALSRVAAVEAGSGVRIVDAAGRRAPLDVGGYVHFEDAGGS